MPDIIPTDHKKIFKIHDVFITCKNVQCDNYYLSYYFAFHFRDAARKCGGVRLALY